MDAIYNERIKLLATFVNGIGIATFAVGGLAPLISSFNGPAGPTLFLSVLSAVCTLWCKQSPQKDEIMTTPQMLSLFIMPAGGLLIAFVALYVTRPKSDDKSHPRHTH